MKITTLAGIMLLSALSLSAESIGEVILIDGDVQLYRDNQEIGDISFGSQIKNFDHFVTGPDSLVEVAIYPEFGLQASILIQENTAMYFAISENQDVQSIELLTGTLEITVSPTNIFNIRTESALMQVRNFARFALDAPISGNVLLSVGEGIVECRSYLGQILFASVDEAAELSLSAVADSSGTGRRWRNISLPGRASESRWQSWRDNWLSRELVDFDPAEALASMVSPYLVLKDRFIRAYVRLMNEREIIHKWMDEDRIGKIGSRSTQIRETHRVSEALANILSIQFFLERIYYRLDQLINQYPNLAGDSQVSPALSFRNFNRQFQEDRILRRMNEVRYILKLYDRRSAEPLPFVYPTESESESE